MALAQAIDFRGISVPDAYQRVTHVAISAENRTVVVEVKTYASATARASTPGHPIETESFTIRNESPVPRAKRDADGVFARGDDGALVMEDVPAAAAYDDFLANKGEDPIAKAYLSLKQTPAFSGARDV